jgi:hypothetical protein
LHITVFSAEARPAALWKAHVEPQNWSKKVAVVKVNPVGTPPAGATGSLFVHTSAGMARIDLAKVAEQPAPPSELELVLLKAKCIKPGSVWHGPGSFDFHWLVDPPPWELASGVLHQWLLRADTLPAGTVMSIERTSGTSRQVMEIHGTGQRLSAPITTERTDQLRLNLTSSGELHATLDQRILAVTDSHELGASITDFARTQRGRIAILAGDQMVIFDRGRGVVSRIPAAGISTLSHDEHGLLGWGPGGAVRVLDRALLPVVSAAVHDAKPVSPGRLVLHTAVGQLHLQGTRTVPATEVQVRAARAQSIGMKTLTLASGHIVVARGSTLLVTAPGRFVLDVRQP